MEATERKRMLGRWRNPTPLDIAIAEILRDMQGYDPETPEYERLLTRLERLNKLRTEHRRWRFSPDTVLLVAGNLVGILIIVGYERGHVMTTRAKEYVLKP